MSLEDLVEEENQTEETTEEEIVAEESSEEITEPEISAEADESTEPEVPSEGTKAEEQSGEEATVIGEENIEPIEALAATRTLVSTHTEHHDYRP